MNFRWLRSNRTLLALLAAAIVTVVLLAILVVRQQQDDTTDQGQVSLEKVGSGGTGPIPLIPTDPPQAVA
ncbi:MAG: hypothetical protein ACRDTT_21495, partial [Pseudonocardiaceae bacterium]